MQLSNAAIEGLPGRIDAVILGGSERQGVLRDATCSDVVDLTPRRTISWKIGCAQENLEISDALEQRKTISWSRREPAYTHAA
jgi:hypothetical protein